MVFQCGLSSGIPVYWQNLVWRSLGQVTSQHETPDVCNWYGESCLSSTDFIWLATSNTQKLWWCSYQMHAQSNVEVLTCVKSRTGIHLRAVNSELRLNIQRPVHLLTGVPPSCHYTPRNEVRGGILDSACLSVCLSVCPSVCPLTFSCPPCSIYSSWWILSIFGTNDQ